ncbi:MAG: hypothetical protein P1V21_24460 [Rhizobiaceae bacterium]|nr:hypothetical protein [Rhizobiaceae bacterium]
MQNAKQDVVKMLDGLPENASLEDIQYHLYVLEKVKKGKDRLANEGGIDQADVEKRLQKWLIK